MPDQFFLLKPRISPPDRTRLLGSLLLAPAIAMMFLVAPLRAEITAEQVRDAIEGAVNFLKRQQRGGAWPEVPGYPGGVTALCTLALLSAGVGPADPAIQAALTYLRKIPPEKTYVVSLQTMVFCRAEPEKDRALIERNVRWLEQMQVKDDPATAGGWGYPTRSADNSNSQFALLALYEAERIGIPIENRTWRLAKAYWERLQNPDGSWGYRPGLFGTGSMTAAGIASLVIINGQLRMVNAQVEGERILCCRAAPQEADRIQRALQWLGRDDVFSVSYNPGLPGAWWLYYMYGLERVGRLTNLRFIGRHDWFRAGAEQLLRAKGTSTDRWIGLGPDETNEYIATAFALMFLAKGRWPVLMAKLQHGPESQWNAHRSDVANLTSFVERRWQRDLVWQIISLEKATVEDLLEAPVLYFVGQENPLPESADAQRQWAAKLRGYLDRGGFLLAEANCGGQGFDEGFRQLLELIFPEPEYRLGPIPLDHPIWRAELPVPAQGVRPLWGVEFGCRTALVYVPPSDEAEEPLPSLSCLWELARPMRGESYPQAVQAKIDAALALGVNILAYATNRELKYKEPSVRPPAERIATEQMRHRLVLINLRHAGGCSTAPMALVNLAQGLSEKLHLPASAEAELLDLTDPSLFQFPIVFFHGRNAFHLTRAERERLRAYLERGGSMLANAICSSSAFSEAFRREMAELFPDRSLKPIAENDPIFSGQFGGFDLRQVVRRVRSGGPARGDKLLLVKGPPVLEGLEIDGRYAVIFSPWDLSCALEGHRTLQCEGYGPVDALRIAINAVLYFLSY